MNVGGIEHCSITALYYPQLEHVQYCGIADNLYGVAKGVASIPYDQVTSVTKI
jgi:hypothetical protein